MLARSRVRANRTGPRNTRTIRQIMAWPPRCLRARTRALGEMGRDACADQRDLPDRPKV